MGLQSLGLVREFKTHKLHLIGKVPCSSHHSNEHEPELFTRSCDWASESTHSECLAQGHNIHTHTHDAATTMLNNLPSRVCFENFLSGRSLQPPSHHTTPGRHAGDPAVWLGRRFSVSMLNTRSGYISCVARWLHFSFPLIGGGWWLGG